MTTRTNLRKRYHTKNEYKQNPLEDENSSRGFALLKGGEVMSVFSLIPLRNIASVALEPISFAINRAQHHSIITVGTESCVGRNLRWFCAFFDLFDGPRKFNPSHNVTPYLINKKIQNLLGNNRHVNLLQRLICMGTALLNTTRSLALFLNSFDVMSNKVKAA